MQRICGYVRLQGSGTPVAAAVVEVFGAGTLIPSTIWADKDGSSLKANPFAADAYGFFFFYAANGRYDVRFSGGTIPSAFSWGDIRTLDVEDDVAIAGMLSVSGVATFATDVVVGGDLSVAGDAAIGGDQSITGDQSVTGDQAVGGGQTVTGASDLAGGISTDPLVVQTIHHDDGTYGVPAVAPTTSPTSGTSWDNVLKFLQWSIEGAKRLWLGNNNLNLEGDFLPGTTGTFGLGGPTKRWKTANVDEVTFGPAGWPKMQAGSGTPEANVTAPVGSIWLRTDTGGGAGTILYVKESGTGDTGWVAK